METGVRRAGEGRSVWVVGDLYTIKSGGEQTGGAFALIEVLIPPQAGPPPHVHLSEDEAFYVLEGELEFHADGQSFLAGPGSWVTLPRGSLHHFKNVGSTNARALIHVSPAGLERFFLEVGRPAVDGERPDMTPDDIEKLLSAAPRYGLDIRLPT